VVALTHDEALVPGQRHSSRRHGIHDAKILLSNLVQHWQADPTGTSAPRQWIAVTATGTALG
jgi:hypothetical protein